MWDSGAKKHLRRRQNVCGCVYISLPTNWNHCGSIFLLLPCYCFFVIVVVVFDMISWKNTCTYKKVTNKYHGIPLLDRCILGSTIVVSWYVKFSTITKEFCAVPRYKKCIGWQYYGTWKCTLLLKFMYHGNTMVFLQVHDTSMIHVRNTMVVTNNMF